MHSHPGRLAVPPHLFLGFPLYARACGTSSVSTVTAKNGGLESENARLNAQVHALQSRLTESDTLRQRTHKLEDRVRDLEELVNQLTAKDKQNVRLCPCECGGSLPSPPSHNCVRPVAGVAARGD